MDGGVRSVRDSSTQSSSIVIGRIRRGPSVGMERMRCIKSQFSQALTMERPMDNDLHVLNVNQRTYCVSSSIYHPEKLIKILE